MSIGYVLTFPTLAKQLLVAQTMFKYSAPEVTEQGTKLINQEWEEQVLTRLPAETEEQALRLGAFVRCREIKSVGDLLRALLAYVLCVSSFRQLGSWAVLLGLANISDTAWRKRLSGANAWLLWPLSSIAFRSPGSL